ncbi:MAG TPA: ABC transporter ATP-binding protein [Desulfobulbus sp.]|nr:ABC transporter ATP-binding protein [Desulfobulbus sp.]
MLLVKDVATWYGQAQVLFGVSLEVCPGEVVALMGRNGMGKTTLIRSIMGLTPIGRGTITWQGRPIHELPPHRIARLGLGLVPEGRQIFPTLTVRENLLAVAADHGGSDEPFTLDRVYAMFPCLAERSDHLGRDLSGGEQQMLAIGRALMTNPSLLLLDEATEGLAPMVCCGIWRALGLLKERGLSILVVDRNIDALQAIGDRLCILEKGRIVWQDTSPFRAFDMEMRMRYLGV